MDNKNSIKFYVKEILRSPLKNLKINIENCELINCIKILNKNYKNLTEKKSEHEQELIKENVLKNLVIIKDIVTEKKLNSNRKTSFNYFQLSEKNKSDGEINLRNKKKTELDKNNKKILNENLNEFNDTNKSFEYYNSCNSADNIKRISYLFSDNFKKFILNSKSKEGVEKESIEELKKNLIINFDYVTSHSGLFNESEYKENLIFVSSETIDLKTNNSICSIHIDNGHAKQNNFDNNTTYTDFLSFVINFSNDDSSGYKTLEKDDNNVPRRDTHQEVCMNYKNYKSLRDLKSYLDLYDIDMQKYQHLLTNKSNNFYTSLERNLTEKYSSFYFKRSKSLNEQGNRADFLIYKDLIDNNSDFFFIILNDLSFCKNKNSKHPNKVLNYELECESKIMTTIALWNKGEFKQAAYELKILTLSSYINLESMYLYGLALKLGLGVKQSYRFSIKWLSKCILVNSHLCLSIQNTQKLCHKLQKIETEILIELVKNSIVNYSKLNTTNHIESMIKKFSTCSSDEIDCFKSKNQNVIKNAFHELGTFIINGWGISKNENLGMKFLAQAGIMGSTKSVKILNNMWMKKTKYHKKNTRKALAWHHLNEILEKKMSEHNLNYKKNYILF